MSSLLGVILAGGKAERLPNKLLLPTRSSIPVILNSIQFLIYNGVSRIRVVSNRQDLVWNYLMGIGIKNVELIDDGKKGIVDAICLAAEGEKVVILCGDNVYPMVKVEMEKKIYAVCVRSDNKQLDGWDEENHIWVSRSKNPLLKLASPWVVESADLDPRHDILKNFNRMQVMPCVHPAFSNWRDLGTIDQYRKYIEGE